MLIVPHTELHQYVDRALEPSDWLMIDQARIDAFADATLDHQFIALKTPYRDGTTHVILRSSTAD